MGENMRFSVLWDKIGDVAKKLATKADKNHTHVWGEIKNKPNKYDNADKLDGHDASYFATNTAIQNVKDYADSKVIRYSANDYNPNDKVDVYQPKPIIASMEVNNSNKWSSSTGGGRYGIVYTWFEKGIDNPQTARQQYLDTGGRLFERHSRASIYPNWSNWVEYPKMSDIPQTNGKLIEGSGSNWIRYEDGTQMCWDEVTLDFHGTGSLTNNWYFPQSFKNGSYYVSHQTYGALGGNIAMPQIADRQRNYVNLQWFNNRESPFKNGDTITVMAFAVGKWK